MNSTPSYTAQTFPPSPTLPSSALPALFADMTSVLGPHTTHSNKPQFSLDPAPQAPSQKRQSMDSLYLHYVHTTHLLTSISLSQTPTISLSRARTAPHLRPCQPPSEDTQCQVCQSRFDEQKMLLCDICNAGWNMDCFICPLTIPCASVPLLPPHPRVHCDISASPLPFLTLIVTKHRLGRKKKGGEKKPTPLSLFSTNTTLNYKKLFPPNSTFKPPHPSLRQTPPLAPRPPPP